MTGKGKNILIVDDEKVVSDFLLRLFKLKSMTAKAVDDGFEAIRLASQEKFDLVFLDVRMPKINGLEIFRKMRQAAPDSKYVMMTGYAVDDLLEQAKKEGAVDSLKKPFDIGEIERVLNII